MTQKLKLIVVTVGSLFLFIGVIACANSHGNTTNTATQPPKEVKNSFTDKEKSDAEQFAKQYVKTFFHIKYNKVPKTLEAKNAYYSQTYQPLMTHDEFQNLMQNREFDALRNGPVHEHLNTSVRTIHIQIYKENLANKNIEMKYHTQLIYKNESNVTQYDIPIKGQLTVTRNNGNWKISRDWSNWKSAIPIKLLAGNENK